jgi:hypothetical protein
VISRAVPCCFSMPVSIERECYSKAMAFGSRVLGGLFPVTGFAVTGFAVTTLGGVGCAGQAGSPIASPSAAPTASTTAKPSSTTRPPAVLGPMPSMHVAPNQGARGAAGIRRETDPALLACEAKMQSTAKDAASLLRTCSPQAKTVLTQTLNLKAESGTTSRLSLNVATGSCYRFFVDTKVQAFALVVLDSQSMTVLDQSSTATDGYVCPEAAGSWSLALVSGLGDGTAILTVAQKIP